MDLPLLAFVLEHTRSYTCSSLCREWISSLLSHSCCCSRDTSCWSLRMHRRVQSEDRYTHLFSLCTHTREQRLLWTHPPVGFLLTGLSLLPQCVNLLSLLLAVSLKPSQLLLPLLCLQLRLLQTGSPCEHRLSQLHHLLIRI